MSRAAKDELEIVDEAQVDRWVADLRKLVVVGQLELMARVGEYLVKHIYGSLEEAKSKRPRKPASLARLAERAEEFGMTPASLARSVPLHLQVLHLGKTLSSKLSLEHHRALLPLRDPAAKKQLAERSAAAGWSSSELTDQRRRLQKPHAGGRPPRPRGVLLLEQVDALLGDVRVHELELEQGHLDDAGLRVQLSRVNRAQATLERIERQLQRQLGRNS